MPDDVYKPTPAERPRLVDFLVVAEHRMLDIGLRMWVGAIEVGLVGTSAGRVVFAELPGASGDAALQLLASLTEARVVPETWTARVTNVESHWRRLVSERELAASGLRGPRLAAAREALRDWIDGDGESYEDDEPNSRAVRVAVELLDWAAIMAYLDGDLARAEQLLERRKSLGADPICRANLERLRLRRLDDELDDSLHAKVAGGAE